MITIRDLSKQYPDSAGPLTILRNLQLQIEKCESISILGKSGSGKSTLLHLIAGLDQPTSGEIIVAGRALSSLNRSELAEYRARTIGMIFQSFYLIPNRTAWENVQLPLELAGKSRRERKKDAALALESVEMGGRLNHLPTQLSGGEKQRVAIARAIVHKPNVLVADEPTGNLDSQTGQTIRSLILNLVRDYQMTFVLVTHDHELAKAGSTRLFTMQDGLLTAKTS